MSSQDTLVLERTVRSETDTLTWDNSKDEASPIRQILRTYEQRDRQRIYRDIRVWEAESYPIPYPSQILESQPTSSSENSSVGPYQVSTVIIPSQHEHGRLRSLFSSIPEISLKHGRQRVAIQQMLLQLIHIEHPSAATCVMISSLVRKCLKHISSFQQQNWYSVCLANYVATRLVLYQLGQGHIWVRSGISTYQRAYLKHFTIQEGDRRVVLVMTKAGGTRFSTLVDLDLYDVLYSAQKDVAFTPLFEEDGHGFKLLPNLRDIYYKA